MENRNKVSRDIAYQKENIKRIPFSIQLSEYDIFSSLTVEKESRAHKRRNYAIYELLLSF